MASKEVLNPGKEDKIIIKWGPYISMRVTTPWSLLAGSS
jgi:hypothetical protein